MKRPLQKWPAIVGISAVAAGVMLWMSLPEADRSASAADAASATPGLVETGASGPGGTARPWTALPHGQEPARALLTGGVQSFAQPRSQAQAKLGAGAILEALHGLPAQVPGEPHAVPKHVQAAALRRAGIPEKYIDGEKLRVDINLALSPEEIDDGGTLRSAAGHVLLDLQSQGIEASEIVGSPTLQASVPLERLEWVLDMDAVAGIALMTIPEHVQQQRVLVTSQGFNASGTDRLQEYGRDEEFDKALREGLHGQGMTISVLDAFNNAVPAAGQPLDQAPYTISSLRGLGEWPSAQNSTSPFPLAVGANNAGPSHGNAVVEIIHDIAPHASFRLYQAQVNGAIDLSRWVDSLRDAANLDQNDARLGAPRTDVFTASTWTGGLKSPGDGTGGYGPFRALYNAIGAARRNGVTVFNAAGNHAELQWSGQFAPLPVQSGAGPLDHHVFRPGGLGAGDFTGEVNLLGLPRAEFEGANLAYPADGVARYCLPVVQQLAGGFGGIVNRLALDVHASLTWNDWAHPATNEQAANRTDDDYSLELMVLNHQVGRDLRGNKVRTRTGWARGLQSDSPQNGANGQLPFEEVSIAKSTLVAENLLAPECDNVFGPGSYGVVFGVRVVRGTQASSNYLRLISTSGLRFHWGNPDGRRSILPPADSRDLTTVGAIDAVTRELEPYSSRGPILSAGGGAPGLREFATVKPDLVSYANVDTKSYGLRAGGRSFDGTSAATPHAAAFGLLSLQLQRKLSSATLLPSPGSTANADEVLAFVTQKTLLSDLTVKTLRKIASVHDLGAQGEDPLYGVGNISFHQGSDACFLAIGYRPEYRGLYFTRPVLDALPPGELDDSLRGFEQACTGHAQQAGARDAGQKK